MLLHIPIYREAPADHPQQAPTKCTSTGCALCCGGGGHVYYSKQWGVRRCLPGMCLMATCTYISPCVSLYEPPSFLFRFWCHFWQSQSTWNRTEWRNTSHNAYTCVDCGGGAWGGVPCVTWHCMSCYEGCSLVSWHLHMDAATTKAWTRRSMFRHWPLQSHIWQPHSCDSKGLKQ